MLGSGLRIGIASAIMPADPERKIYGGKTLLYTSEQAIQWFMTQGSLAYLIPTQREGTTSLSAYAADLDGLVLQGGTDVNPGAYGEIPLRPEWAGDPTRDFYEFALLEECVELGVPVIGLCRGAQVINACFGGSLYQDIATQKPEAISHRNAEIYDRNGHDVSLSPGGLLSKIYSEAKSLRVNSVHHQAIKDLANGFVVEAQSVADGVIEAIRWDVPHRPRYVLGLQWHPEWTRSDCGFADATPLLRSFLEACQQYREQRSSARQ